MIDLVRFMRGLKNLETERHQKLDVSTAKNKAVRDAAYTDFQKALEAHAASYRAADKELKEATAIHTERSAEANEVYSREVSAINRENARRLNQYITENLPEDSVREMREVMDLLAKEEQSKIN